MASLHDLTLRGASGKDYVFGVYPTGTKFTTVGGNYCILALDKAKNQYLVVYTGQTGDLSTRFADHHKDACFKRNSETHIAVRGEKSDQARLSVERDLIGSYAPTCNG